MNLSYSKGAISTSMIINILLAVLIVIAIVVLFFTDNNGDSPSLVKSPLPVKVTKTPRAALSAPVSAQTDIDALKKQLERESSKLDTLREDEKRIEALRKASELEAAKIAEAQAASAQGEITESTQNKAKELTGKASETKTGTAPEKAVE